MRAMILSAGLGQRLRPHTEKVGKPALPFLNLPLICYPFFHLNKLGLSQLVVNTHHCPESIKTATQNLGYSPIQFSHESPEILGSGGGIKQAEDYLRGEGNFIVANGDEILLAPHGLKAFWEEHLKSGAIASLFLCPHPDVGTRFGGVWCNADGEVRGFGKSPTEPGLKGLHYTGFIALADRVFDYLPKNQVSNILYDALTHALTKGESVRGHLEENIWYETGSEADFLRASQSCLKHLMLGDEYGRSIEELLNHFGRILLPQAPGVWVGERTTIPSSVSIEGPCLVGNHVEIGANTQIRGFGIIGDNCTVGNNCVLENGILGPNLTLPANSQQQNFLTLP